MVTAIIKEVHMWWEKAAIKHDFIYLFLGFLPHKLGEKNTWQHGNHNRQVREKVLDLMPRRPTDRRFA